MIRTLSLIAIFAITTVGNADTILKFDLGTAGFDFALSGGMLETTDDGIAATVGDQNTNVNYTGILAGMSDISADIASFTLSDVALDGPATVIGGAIVVQPTTGGEFRLWDDANSLLLSGTLSDGSISGSLGPSATGSFFNLDMDAFTGGSLAPLLDPNSMSLSLSFTDVNNGLGFSVADNVLQPFQAAATGNIAAAVPEPTGCILALCGCTLALRLRRRR